MKLKYILICLLAIGLFPSCKSKKQATYHPKKNQEKIAVSVKGKELGAIINESKETITTSTLEYIDLYKEAAMNEMREFKIPASIILAQGIIESSSGNSELTKKSNNHFGIKCHVGWDGGQVYHDDDEKGECFRVYVDPRTSYRDHSLFLTSRSRYSNLFNFEPDDYISWAQGLSEAGYATDRRYPAKLIGLIEKFVLNKYDSEVLGKSFVAPKYSKSSNYIVVKGDTLYSISKKYDLSVEELKKMNGLYSNEISIGQTLSLAK